MAPRKTGDERAVEVWNRCHPVGTAVRYWSMARRGAPTGQGTTLEPACLLGGTAVVRITRSHRDGTDLLALTHVEPLPTLTLVWAPVYETAAVEVFLPELDVVAAVLLRRVADALGRTYHLGLVDLSGRWSGGMRVAVRVPPGEALDAVKLVDRLLVREAEIVAVVQFRCVEPTECA